MSLAAAPPPRSKAGRERVAKHATRAVAELLGNTPAVARRAYIDPRVFDRYLAGDTIAPIEALPHDSAAAERLRPRLEPAVLRLLED